MPNSLDNAPDKDRSLYYDEEIRDLFDRRTPTIPGTVPLRDRLRLLTDPPEKSDDQRHRDGLRRIRDRR